ncbi:MAG: hypothetical protein AC479_02335 [miscellaneous Crenarchaeota group-6 archaeon AD8-1]|nr:MAG: hypothetical protein AC479_02335 [miscellaneous Crenarchaeota group-6 archaeon AD8-1]
MRLDYTMYILGVFLLILTIVPFIVEIQGIDDNIKLIWVISSAILGVLSFALGYSQKPKTKAQACQIEETSCKDEPKSSIKENVEMKEENEFKSKKTEKYSSYKIEIDLIRVKGIGQKRAIQLKEIGINTANDLANEPSEKIAKKLNISPKITKKWKNDAEQLLKNTK